MADRKKLFLEAMDAEGIRYTDVDENAVQVTFTGIGSETTAIRVLFREDETVTFYAGHLLICLNPGVTYARCSEVNQRMRWLKFYLRDEDQKEAMIAARIDALLSNEATCGEKCVWLLRMMASRFQMGYEQIIRIVDYF